MAEQFEHWLSQATSSDQYHGHHQPQQSHQAGKHDWYNHAESGEGNFNRAALYPEYLNVPDDIAAAENELDDGAIAWSGGWFTQWPAAKDEAMGPTAAAAPGCGIPVTAEQDTYQDATDPRCPPYDDNLRLSSLFGDEWDFSGRLGGYATNTSTTESQERHRCSGSSPQETRPRPNLISSSRSSSSSRNDRPRKSSSADSTASTAPAHTLEHPTPRAYNRGARGQKQKQKQKQQLSDDEEGSTSKAGGGAAGGSGAGGSGAGGGAGGRRMAQTTGELRRMRNRKATKKSQLKKKQYMLDAGSREQDLIVEWNSLRDELATLQSDVNDLRQEILQHRDCGSELITAYITTSMLASSRPSMQDPPRQDPPRPGRTRV